MAKRVSRRTQNDMVIHTWWANLLLALVLGGLSYGFASWAIDSGNLLQYVAAILLGFGAIGRLIRTVRIAINN